MTNLTDDEYAVLMIHQEGGSVAAVAWWEKPCDSLVARGLLKRHDKFNHGITTAGRQAIKEREAQDDQALRGALTGMAQKMDSAASTQASIQEFVRQAADLLAQAARASSLVTGDAPAVSAQRWGEVIINEAISRIR